MVFIRPDDGSRHVFVPASAVAETVLEVLPVG
jgi:cold shock CspA family protein